MSRKGLLIVNLGSPETVEVSDVRSYLNQFLMDGEVIDLPWFFRLFLVRGIIVPFRAKKSAEAYTQIFSDRGSPLKFHSEDFVALLRQNLSDDFSKVELAMRYGTPSIESKIDQLIKDSVDEVFIVPMYPQFAKSSTRTVLYEVEKSLKKHNNSNLKARVVLDFFTEDFYIETFATAIKEEVESFNPDHLMLSYHGLPERHVKEFAPSSCFKSSDCCSKMTSKNRFCYRAQCFESSRLFLQKLSQMGVSLPHTVSFQSRLGREEWIKPYTDHEINRLVENGVKRLLVACPAFVADCLETLEEIAIRLKEDFISLGGEDLKLVPSLNARPDWIFGFSDALKNQKMPFIDFKQGLDEVKS